MHEGNRVPAQATIALTPALAARAAVLLPLPLPQAYDYVLPDGVVPKRGMIVRASLGPREVIGAVWGKPDAAVPAEKMKLAEPIDGFRLPAQLCDFIDWVARYTISSPGQVLAQALRVSAA